MIETKYARLMATRTHAKTFKMERDTDTGATRWWIADEAADRSFVGDAYDCDKGPENAIWTESAAPFEKWSL